jgi:hypothetical protein
MGSDPDWLDAELEIIELRAEIRRLKLALEECIGMIFTSDERGNIKERETDAVNRARALISD